ncbi:MAG TPA: Phenylacetic acid catabolic protein [Candidatus Polarisedimenticolia bacterium]|nr:Phenylacetic acid catabolic protein [Candidatus Polarisedimenticolia bacterium]
MSMSRPYTFDDWIDHFRRWQQEIDLDPAIGAGYPFEAKYGDLHSEAIEFGDFKGDRKWKTVLEVPDQRIRDALLHLITYQGDTEFGSVEQQRRLVATAPSEADLQSLIRIMREEMRHGWQMCHLLINHFGSSGKVEARKLLERRSFKNQRLLGSFNVPVDNWLDFFTYTQFVDRDGKFQLGMLSHSAFAPLARSMGPMLKEESFHLGTGNSGLKRIIKAGRLPMPLVQKYFNKWIPTAYDLFGTDGSSSAHWSYVWGLKGRFNEDQNPEAADRDHLNEYARALYVEEVQGLIDALNRDRAEGSPALHLPDVKFNRRIGEFAGGRFSVRGEPLDEAAHARHLAENLPGDADRGTVDSLSREAGWILPR